MPLGYEDKSGIILLNNKTEWWLENLPCISAKALITEVCQD